MRTSKKRFPENPHLWPCWYPKSKRYYWRVSPTPKPYTFERLQLYRKANDFKCVLNNQHSAELERRNSKMKTSKKKLKHTPHIVRGQHGKFYATTWGNPSLTAEQRKLHDKAQTFTDRLNRKA